MVRQAPSRSAAVDMFCTCKHVLHMSKMIQIRHVPEALHRRLRARAALAGMSLSDYLRHELEASASRLSPAELRARLSTLEPVHVRERPEDAVRAERDNERARK
jgi:antitoxin FitA